MTATLTPEQRERKRARERAYYAAHKVERSAKQRAYAATHRLEIAAQQRAWYARMTATERKAHIEKRHAGVLAWQRERRYGITQDEFDALLAYQDGICVGCNDAPATDVDHDHETGDIRGLLCRPCNLADVLGMAWQDDWDDEWEALHPLDVAVTIGPSAKPLPPTPAQEPSKAWENEA